MNNNQQLLLDQVIAEQKNDIAPDYEEGEFFGIFVAKEILKNEDLSYEEILEGITDGSLDGGIDAFYFFLESRLINEIDSYEEKQIKYNPKFRIVIIQSTRTASFKETKVINIKNTINDLFDLTREINKEQYNQKVINKTLLFQELYKKYASKFPKIEVDIIYASRSIENPNSIIESRISDLISDVKSKLTNAECNFSFINANKLWEIANQRKKSAFQLRHNALNTSSSEYDTVCLVELGEYYNFITSESGELEKTIFESNVRDHQGNVEVNKSIGRTLMEQKPNEDFWWLNNGITILCSDHQTQGNVLTIKEPQIVNGLQTSYEIFNFYNQEGNTTHNREEGNAERHVLVRVIKPKNIGSRVKIIKATNSQSAIPPSQIRATDNIHFNIEKYFEKNNLYYDRRKNFYKNIGKPISDIIGIPRLAQSINAILLKRPHESRAKPSSLLKTDKRYKEIFNDNYNLEFFLVSARLIMKIHYFIKKTHNKGFSPDLIYHLAMYTAIMETKKEDPKEADIIRINVTELENKELEAHADDISTEIIKIYGKDYSINTIAKSSRFTSEIDELAKLRLKGNQE